MEIKPLAPRIAAGFAAFALAGAGLGLAANPAQAAFDGNCGSGEVCLFYNTSYTGGTADFGGNISNYSGYLFWNTSHALNDNSASAKNRGTFQDVHLHEHSNYGGTKLELNPGVNKSDLGAMKNVTSSHRW